MLASGLLSGGTGEQEAFAEVRRFESCLCFTYVGGRFDALAHERNAGGLRRGVRPRRLHHPEPDRGGRLVWRGPPRQPAIVPPSARLRCAMGPRRVGNRRERDVTPAPGQRQFRPAGATRELNRHRCPVSLFHDQGSRVRTGCAQRINHHLITHRATDTVTRADLQSHFAGDRPFEEATPARRPVAATLVAPAIPSLGERDHFQRSTEVAISVQEADQSRLLEVGRGGAAGDGRDRTRGAK